MEDKFCCEAMEGQLTNKCKSHGLECPDNVVRIFDGKFRKAHGIPHPDGNSYYVIDYCPWCGSKLENVEKDD